MRPSPPPHTHALEPKHLQCLLAGADLSCPYVPQSRRTLKRLERRAHDENRSLQCAHSVRHPLPHPPFLPGSGGGGAKRLFDSSRCGVVYGAHLRVRSSNTAWSGCARFVFATAKSGICVCVCVCAEVHDAHCSRIVIFLVLGCSFLLSSRALLVRVCLVCHLTSGFSLCLFCRCARGALMAQLHSSPMRRRRVPRWLVLALVCFATSVGFGYGLITDYTVQSVTQDELASLPTSHWATYNSMCNFRNVTQIWQDTSMMNTVFPTL